MKNMTNLKDGVQVLTTMHHYAFLDQNDVVEMIVSLPSLIQDSQYISISTADQTLVGKKYNRTTGEFEDIMFYYAILDNKDIVTDVVALSAQVTDSKKISVPTYDKSIVGKWYNRATGTFEAVPIHILAKLNTGEINVLKADGIPEDKWLDVKLKEIDNKLNALGNESFGAYKTSFNIKNNVAITSEWVAGKSYTFNFDTGISGYFPKMIRIVGTSMQDDVLVAELYITKNADGTVKNTYLDKVYVGVPIGSSEKKRYVDYNVDVKWDAFIFGIDNQNVVYDTGGSAFVGDLSTAGARVAIQKLAYTENTFSFIMEVSQEAVGKYTAMNLKAYVF